MSHSFNDSVVYVRNGKPIPAIVLSSLMSDRGELLTVLYAQPEIGPTLLAQGTTRGIAQVQQALAPFKDGNTFGWKDEIVETAEAPKTPADEMVGQLQVQLAGVSTAAFGVKTEVAKQGDYGWSVPYQDVLDLREKYDALQVKLESWKETVTAPEQLDEAQGPVTPGDPESPHAIEPESIKLAPEVPLVEGEPGSTSDNPLAG